jgi:hypothetical protein
VLRRTPLLASFEDRQLRRPVDVDLNRRLFEALYREAVELGALPPADPLEGIDVDLRVARAVNG